MTGTRRDPPLEPPRAFLVALLPGALMIGYGIRGLLASTDTTDRWSIVRWLVGGNLAQDLVVSPLACAVGLAAARWLPAVVRGPVQAALVASGAIGAVAYPFVRAYGRTAGEPSFLARDYATSLLTLWAAVWLVAVVVVTWRILRRRGTA